MKIVSLPFFVTIQDRSNLTHGIESTLKSIAVLAFATFVTGCTSMMSIGSPEYSCSGLPEGGKCQSTRDVYENTHDGNVPLKLETEDEFKEKKSKRKRRSRESSSEVVVVEEPKQTGSGDTVIDNYVAPRLPDRPIPVRTPAQVMRIWVAPWEDTNGDLITNGYIYTEIEPRRWVIGQTGAAAPTVLKPLQTITGSSKNRNDKSK